LGKPRRRQLGPRQERLVPRGGLRELVPRANGQAIVAAVDAISDPRAEFVRDRPFKLDRQIGNAAPGIELERSRESLGGASILAGRAGPATLVMAKVRLERQRGVDSTEKQPRTMLPADQVRVLALPAQARRLAERLFHHRRSVDEDLELRLD